LYIYSLWYRHSLQVTVPEAVYIQLRRRPPDDEQGNVQNM